MRAPDVRDLEGLPPSTRKLVTKLVKSEVARLLAEERAKNNRVTIVVFSGDLDKVIASLVIATGAASMGMDVSMFFTFWGLSVLRRTRKLAGKGVLTRAMSLLTPKGLEALGVSKLNFGGAGALALKR